MGVEVGEVDCMTGTVIEKVKGLSQRRTGCWLRLEECISILFMSSSMVEGGWGGAVEEEEEKCPLPLKEREEEEEGGWGEAVISVL